MPKKHEFRHFSHQKRHFWRFWSPFCTFWMSKTETPCFWQGWFFVRKVPKITFLPKITIFSTFWPFLTSFWSKTAFLGISRFQKACQKWRFGPKTCKSMFREMSPFWCPFSKSEQKVTILRTLCFRPFPMFLGQNAIFDIKNAFCRKCHFRKTPKTVKNAFPTLQKVWF